MQISKQLPTLMLMPFLLLAVGHFASYQQMSITADGMMINNHLINPLLGAEYSTRPKAEQEGQKLKPVVKSGTAVELKLNSTVGLRSDKWLQPGVSGKMVLVRGGTFQMGSPDPDIGGSGCADDENPVHQVKVDDFYLGAYEVTFMEYDAFCAAKGKRKIQVPSGYRTLRPVTNVSWEDAVAYCNWRSEREGLQTVYNISDSTVSWNIGANGYRLPTEAEWEYAAGGGSSERNIWSGTSIESRLVSYSWYHSGATLMDDRSYRYKYTTKVGSYFPNGLGLYDMSGNVMEWCWDWYDKDYYKNSPLHNPMGPSSSPIGCRVLRGGSWRDIAVDCRVARRQKSDPALQYDSAGFRLARNK